MKKINLVFVVVMIFLMSTTTTSSDYININPINLGSEKKLSDDNAWLSHYTENEAVQGYLYMEDIVSDVVMKSTGNNEHYLYNDRNNKKDVYGELFFSMDSNVDATDSPLDMTRIYGHKMLNGSKFGNLIFLLDAENNRPLYYFDDSGKRTFHLTRAFKYVDGTENFERVLDSGVSKNEYLDKISKDPIVSFVQQHDVEDTNVLFLQTCENATSDIRYVFIFEEVSYEPN